MIQKKELTTINIALVLLTAALIGSVIVLSLVPPISRDALVHHLAIPKLYLKHGVMYEIPSMEFSYYPMNLDLLYMIPLYFGNDNVPKFIHFVFALLTALLIFHYLKRRLDLSYALLGALFFLSIPIIVKLAITVYVDLGVIFFTTGSLLFLLRWVETHFKWRFLILSAAFCGLALGTKYNALVAFFLLTLLIPYLYSKNIEKGKSRFSRAFSRGLVFFFIAALLFTPWLARNYAWTNNPIYPLYDGWFNPPPETAGSQSSQKDKKEVDSGVFTSRSFTYKESNLAIILLPLRIFFQGKDNDPQYFDGKLNPFLLFLPVFAFMTVMKQSNKIRIEKRIMLAFAVLFILFALFSAEMRIRYISPIVPPLIILSVFGIKNISEASKVTRKRWHKMAAYMLVFLLSTLPLAYNFGYIFEQFKYVRPISYLGGYLSRDAYIANYRPEYPALVHINQHVRHDALILFLFLGKRGYFCEREYLLGESTFGQIIKEAKGPEDIKAGLRSLGITHVFIYLPLMDKWMSNNLDRTKHEVLRGFFGKKTRLVYRENGFGVFEIT